MSESRGGEGEPIAGIDISARDMAGLIADALVDRKVVQESDRTKCIEIASEEIWIRKLLVNGPPKEGV